MAHGLRLKVVAEGVETADQLRFLRERNCDEIQGFYFARPSSAVDIIAFAQRFGPTRLGIVAGAA